MGEESTWGVAEFWVSESDLLGNNSGKDTEFSFDNVPFEMSVRYEVERSTKPPSRGQEGALGRGTRWGRGCPGSVGS